MNIWALSENEKRACTVLSKMKSSDHVTFDKCGENDTLVEEATKLLSGNDAIGFAIDVLTSLHGSWTKEYFQSQFKYYLH